MSSSSENRKMCKKPLRSRLPRFNFLKKSPKKPPEATQMEITKQSPKVTKMHKELANLQEKAANSRKNSLKSETAESSSFSKIPILRAKVRDSSILKDEIKIMKYEARELNERAIITSSKSDFWWGAQNMMDPAATTNQQIYNNNKHSITADNINKNLKKQRPKSALISTKTEEILFKLTKDQQNKPVVERGLVRERAKLFEQKIEENQKMVEEPKRPRYWEATLASKARAKPPISRDSGVPINVPTNKFSHNNNAQKMSHNNFAPRSLESKYSITSREPDLLVMNLPSSYSGQSHAWSWSSTSPTEAEIALMHTSSSSNESRTEQKSRKVVASYSSCALVQKPVLKNAKTIMTTSDISGKSSTSPMSESENKVCDYFDDEIDDQPDLTLNENDPPSYIGTPASEYPPTSFGAILAERPNWAVPKYGGGESDARDLACELFMAKKLGEKAKNASLNASLESLESDHLESRTTTKLTGTLTGPQLLKGLEKAKSYQDSNSSMKTKEPQQMTNWRKHPEKLVSGTTMCSHCGINNSNNNKETNNIQLIQDVMSIKAYLQKLRRVLHESDDSSILSPAAVATTVILDPDVVPAFHNKNVAKEIGRNKVNNEDYDEVNDLKRQIAILQQNNVEKDRKIGCLQRQLDCKTLVSSPLRENRSNKSEMPPPKTAPIRKNGATQTDKVRFVSESTETSPITRSPSNSPAGPT